MSVYNVRVHQGGLTWCKFSRVIFLMFLCWPWIGRCVNHPHKQWRFSILGEGLLVADISRIYLCDGTLASAQRQRTCFRQKLLESKRKRRLAEARDIGEQCFVQLHCLCNADKGKRLWISGEGETICLGGNKRPQCGCQIARFQQNVRSQPNDTRPTSMLYWSMHCKRNSDPICWCLAASTSQTPSPSTSPSGAWLPFWCLQNTKFKPILFIFLSNACLLCCIFMAKAAFVRLWLGPYVS